MNEEKKKSQEPKKWKTEQLYKLFKDFFRSSTQQ